MSFWDFLPTLVTAGATLYGANQASKASDRATRQAVQSNNRATDVQLAYLDQAKDTLEENQRVASPGLLRMQEIIARGSDLTPDQLDAVDDSRRQAVNSLRGSSLRGSARATSALVSDVDRRTRNNFMDQNQRRADSAASSLSGQYFGAGNNIANTAASQGSTASQGLINSGNVQAANTLGQGAIRGQAIGDIGAVISDTIKQEIQNERDSSYKEVG